MKKKVLMYEEFSAQRLSEGLGDFFKKYWDKGIELSKEVWDVTKRESKETQEASRILADLIARKPVSDIEKKFLKAQSVDLIKIIPLIAVSGIPVPIPTAALLVVLGKKLGFDFLPDSHKKVEYEI